MRINVDKEGNEAVQGLCDLALKVGGIANMAMVSTILASLRIVDETAKQDKDTFKKVD